MSRQRSHDPARHSTCQLHLSLFIMRNEIARRLVQVDISVTPGTHSTEEAVNKQLNDKERVAAALENPNLVDMVNKVRKFGH